MNRIEGEISIFDQDLWYGKTYPEHSQVESRKEKTSESSLKSARGLKSQMPLYLDLRKENGRISDASWEMGGALPGRYGMHAFTESHNGVGESRLSAILQDKVPPKYYLSARACRGILARAEKRGKMARIPEVLKKALEWQGVDENYRELVRSVSKNEPGSRGGGKGLLIQDEHTGALGTCQHQNVCAIGFAPGAARDVGIAVYDECSKTISNGTCPGHHNGVATYGFDPSASRDVGVAFHQECEKTVCAGGSRQGIVQAYGRGYNWDGTQTVPTLTSRNAGGAQRMPDKENFNAVLTSRETAQSDALNAHDGGGESRTPIVVLETNQPNAQIIYDVSPTLPASAGMGGGYVPMVAEKTNPAPAYGIDRYNQQANLETMNALRTNAGGDNYPIAAQPIRERKR